MWMNSSTKTARSILFYIGLLGVIEQEAARLIFGIAPSWPMLIIFAGFATGAPAAAILSAMLRGYEASVGGGGEKKDGPDG